MAATFKDFYREPSKPHQCMRESEKDGLRCRNAAMHNEFMCYQHRTDDIRTVIENDPFLLENLDTRAAIQHSVGQVAARLACNHIDLKRAGLLLQSIQIAASNLTSTERLATAAANATTTFANAITTAEATANHAPNSFILDDISPDSATPNDVSPKSVILDDVPPTGVILDDVQNPGSCLHDATHSPAPEPSASHTAIQTTENEATTKGPALTDHLPLTTDNSLTPPLRDYTEEETDFLYYTTTSTGHFPGDHRRPVSITNQDIDACKKACPRSGLPPTKPTDPEFDPEFTLPTLQAAAPH